MTDATKPRHSSREIPLLICAGIFVTLGAVSLAIAAPTEALTPRHLYALVTVWTLTWTITYGLLRIRLPNADLLIIPPVALMSGWGLLLLARVAPNFLWRQMLWLILGAMGLCAIALFPALPRLLRRYRYSLLIGGLLLLATTLFFGVNPSGQGARLWLGLFGFYFQPSEILKLLLVIYLAAYLADRREVPAGGDDFRLWPVVLAPMLLMVGLALILLAWQQDLGAALLFYLTFLAMIYLAWGRTTYVIIGLLLFAPIAVAGALLSARVALRVSIWLNPWLPEQADRAFQILQSLFALAAGGLVGQGPGQGRPTLIPAVHTDFVYAALVEEFGTVGALALLALVAVLVHRGLHLAQRTKSPFEGLLAGGIATLLGLQTWVIVAGNTKLIPITGVTLPFLSYGGSSLVTSLIATGLLLNLSAPHRPALSLPLPASRTLPPLRKTAGHLGSALLLLVGIAGLGTGAWTVIRAEELRTYPTNAHRILDELQIRRGRIVDRRGTVLADIDVDEDGFVTRTYPVPEAAPVVGYATLAYGTAGIEGSCDAALRGEIDRTAWEATWDGLLHRPPTGRTVNLTLDARLQELSQNQLEGYRGAAVLVDARTGDILALASAPTYHPAMVEEQWPTLRDDPDAPLLNRATQGVAQPGAVLETVILSALLTDEDPLLPPATPLDKRVSLNGSYLTCRVAPQGEGWAAALAAACPAPFAEAGERLGIVNLQTSFARWGLTEAPALEIPTAAIAWDPAESESAAVDALGQGQLLVTPLQMVGVAATLGNRGAYPPLHLLAEVQPGCEAVPSLNSVPIIDAETAKEIRALWPRWGESIGHLGQALAGPERELTWFIGLNSSSVPRYAVAVLLENSADPEAAADIGNRLLRQAVAP